MKNNMFKTEMSQVTDENRAFVRQYLDYIELKTDIIDTAYSLYMPQIRAEISELFDVISTHSKDKKTYNILEIGTKFGGTFYLWNSINRSGLNISIDLEAGIHGGVSKEEMDKRDLWFNERFDNCKFIRGDSHDEQTLIEVAQILLKLWTGPNSNVGIDFLFIDGDHTYEGVRNDLKMYLPFCNSKSIIAFHDIIISDHHHSRNVYVGEFWNEIKNDSRFDSFEIVADEHQTWAGIGILIKK